jgi:hypothetical protein
MLDIKPIISSILSTVLKNKKNQKSPKKQKKLYFYENEPYLKKDL